MTVKNAASLWLSPRTIHNATGTGAIALTRIPQSYQGEIHVEAPRSWSMAAADFEDGDFFFTVNTSGAAISSTLTPSGFAGAFLRDGTSRDISGGFNLGGGIDSTYLLTITENGGNKFLNAYSLGGSTYKALQLAWLATTDTNHSTQATISGATMLQILGELGDHFDTANAPSATPLDWNTFHQRISGVISFNGNAEHTNSPGNAATGLTGMAVTSMKANNVDGRTVAFLSEAPAGIAGFWTRQIVNGVWGTWQRFSSDAWVDITVTSQLTSGIKARIADNVNVSFTYDGTLAAIRVAPRTDWANIPAFTGNGGWTVQPHPTSGTQEVVYLAHVGTTTWEAKQTVEGSNNESLYVVSDNFAANLGKTYKGQILRDYIRTTTVDNTTNALGPIVRVEAGLTADAALAAIDGGNGVFNAGDPITIVNYNGANRTISGAQELGAGLYSLGRTAAGMVFVPIETHPEIVQNLTGVIVEMGEWSGAVGISNGALTSVNTGMDWSNADYFEVTVTDSFSTGNHKTYRGDIETIRNGGGLLVDRFENQHFWIQNINLPNGTFNAQINNASGWVVRRVRLFGSISLPQYARAGTVRKNQITLSVNGGATVIAPTRMLEGVGATKILVTLPPNQMIDAPTFEGQTLPTGVTAVIEDALGGVIAVEVDDGTGNVDLTVPFTAAPSAQNYVGVLQTGNQAGNTGFTWSISHEHGGAVTLTDSNKNITLPGTNDKFKVTMHVQHYSDAIGSTRIDFSINGSKTGPSFYSGTIDVNNKGYGTSRVIVANSGDVLRAVRVGSSDGGNSYCYLSIEGLRQ